MDPQLLTNVVTIIELIYSLLSLIFFLLVLFVLVYYIRRRYKLYKEIFRIPPNLLIIESYRNHLKNLKIKCIINNFIILILMIEFLQNLGQIILYFPYWITYFVKAPESKVRSLREFQNESALFTFSISYSFVPVLSMMMDFLWLAYRKYEYKFTIIRWTWYIVIRALVVFLEQYSFNYMFLISFGYRNISNDLSLLVYGILPIIDFMQFIYYARKFYLHLKSREKEIRLFYFDKKAYLDSKYLRIHFKISTILVGIAIFFNALANSDRFIFILCESPFSLPEQLYNFFLFVTQIYIGFIGNISFLISELLFIFNYLYIFIIVVYKYYKDRQKLENINNYIRPIIKQYHESYYNRRYTNFA